MRQLNYMIVSFTYRNNHSISSFLYAVEIKKERIIIAIKMHIHITVHVSLSWLRFSGLTF